MSKPEDQHTHHDDRSNPAGGESYGSHVQEDDGGAPERSTDKSGTGRSRRRFVNFLIGGGLLGWLGSLIYPVISFLKPPNVAEANVNSVRAGVASEFANNTSTIVKFGRTPILLVRLESGEFRAFTATCTHLDCIVQYRSDFGHIWCACHNGQYDLNGRNISGPPPRPLQVFDVNIVNDEIVVSKPKQVV